MSMDEIFNMQITQIYAKKYKNSSKKEKSLVLASYCKSTGVSKNLASKRFCKTIRNINPVVLKIYKVGNKRGPKVKYTATHKRLLNKVWELFGCICAERLYPKISKGISDLHKENELTRFNEDEIHLCRKISLGQLKKVVAGYPKPAGYRKRNRKPGIYSQVPVEVNFNKYATKPGYIEVDPVEHNGGNSGGKYVVTGCYVCLFSQWLKRHAALGQNMISIEKIHNSNKEGFIHKIVKYHCDNAPALLKVLFKKATEEIVTKEDKKEVALSRSRPYRKEDNGHVEQKNGDKIRKLVGYYRYDTFEQLKLLNELYEIEDLITNYFIPSQKLKSKTYNSMGKLLAKKYDRPSTPYERLIRSRQVPQKTKTKLKSVYLSLNLVRLRKESERIKSELLNSVLRK